MSTVLPTPGPLDRLKAAGLRRRSASGVGPVLFEAGSPRHGEHLHEEADAAGLRVSLATVYNTLNQFSDVGLLREVVVESGRSYFDTNNFRSSPFLLRGTGQLQIFPVTSPCGRVARRAGRYFH